MYSKNDFYYTYVLRSMKDSTFYIGFTSDLNKRLRYHNKGLSKYTKGKLPWKVFYFEMFTSRSEAIRRELFLKKQRNTKFYLRLVELSAFHNSYSGVVARPPDQESQ